MNDEVETVAEEQPATTEERHRRFVDLDGNALTATKRENGEYTIEIDDGRGENDAASVRMSKGEARRFARLLNPRPRRARRRAVAG